MLFVGIRGFDINRILEEGLEDLKGLDTEEGIRGGAIKMSGCLGNSILEDHRSVKIV
jgi:hypothetical protein